MSWLWPSLSVLMCYFSSSPSWPLSLTHPPPGFGALLEQPSPALSDSFANTSRWAQCLIHTQSSKWGPCGAFGPGVLHVQIFQITRVWLTWKVKRWMLAFWSNFLELYIIQSRHYLLLYLVGSKTPVVVKGTIMYTSLWKQTLCILHQGTVQSYH